MLAIVAPHAAEVVPRVAAQQDAVALRLVMVDDPRLWVIGDLPPGFRGALRPIDILHIEIVSLVHQADGVQQLAAHHDARAEHPIHRAVRRMVGIGHKVMPVHIRGVEERAEGSAPREY